MPEDDSEKEIEKALDEYIELQVERLTTEKLKRLVSAEVRELKKELKDFMRAEISSLKEKPKILEESPKEDEKIKKAFESLREAKLKQSKILGE
ncbi:MAG: hypothetical protein ACE5HW_05695 [Candidatus Methanofastidiosia archaeon]